MSIVPQPKPRRRAPVAVEIAKYQREGLTVIGGPDNVINAAGVFDEGNTNKQWPFVHGAKLIGMVLDEYQTKGKTIWYAGSNSRFVHTHYWVADHAKGELRYKGTAQNRGNAKALIERHQQRVATHVADPTHKIVAAVGTPPPRRRSTI